MSQPSYNKSQYIAMEIWQLHLHFQGRLFVSVQKGKVTATAWMDNKIVRVMSTSADPTLLTSVQRRRRSGDKVSVACPQSVYDYNQLMGGVDNGDQNRGYYRCPTKFRKFYMYIYSFLKDVAITNSYVLYRRYSPSPKHKTVLDFRLYYITLNCQ